MFIELKLLRVRPLNNVLLPSPSLPPPPAFLLQRQQPSRQTAGHHRRDELSAPVDHETQQGGHAPFGDAGQWIKKFNSWQHGNRYIHVHVLYMYMYCTCTCTCIVQRWNWMYMYSYSLCYMLLAMHVVALDKIAYGLHLGEVCVCVCVCDTVHLDYYMNSLAKLPLLPRCRCY